MFKPVLSSSTNKDIIESQLNYCGLFFKTGTKKEDLLNVFSNDNNTSFKVNLNIDITKMLFEDNENLEFDYDKRKYKNWMKKGLKHVIIYNLFTKDYLTMKQAIILQNQLSFIEYNNLIFNQDSGLIKSFSKSSSIYKMVGHTHLIKEFMSNEDKEFVINEIRNILLELDNEEIINNYDNLIINLFQLDDLFESYQNN